MSQQEQPPVEPELPPILGNWSRMYTFVLVMHMILIILFYLFSNAYA